MFVKVLDNEGYVNVRTIDRITAEQKMSNYTVFAHCQGKKYALARNVPEEEIDAMVEKVTGGLIL
jgi:hypothetical protein